MNLVKIHLNKDRKHVHSYCVSRVKTLDSEIWISTKLWSQVACLASRHHSLHKKTSPFEAEKLGLSCLALKTVGKDDGEA